MIKLLLPTVFTLALPLLSHAKGICISAAEDFAYQTAEQAGLSDCQVNARTKTVKPNYLYDVSLLCTAGDAARTIKYRVTTDFEEIRPGGKKGKVYYSCGGVSAIEI